MDVADKGYLNFKDLRRISDRIGNEMNDEDLKEVLNNCSISSHEDKIYFDDFYKIMTTKF